MSALGWVQLVLNTLFLFLILLLFLGRGWRRGTGAAAGSEEQESYRSMVSALSELVRSMKEESAEMQDRLAEKEAELNSAINAADDRLRSLKNVDSRPASGPRNLSSPGVGVTPGSAQPSPGSLGSGGSSAIRPATAANATGEAGRGEMPGQPSPGPGPEPAPAPPEPPGEEERRVRYRQVLEFMEKGWSALDIARFTGLPRGEVELLMRTKGRQ